MAKLWVVEDYKSAKYTFTKGKVIEVVDDVADWLMRDAPGCFSTTAPPEPKSKGKPRKAANKAILEPIEEKDA